VRRLVGDPVQGAVHELLELLAAHLDRHAANLVGRNNARLGPQQRTGRRKK
jgi:hypothetical protein